MIVDFVARVSHLFLEKKRNGVTIKFMEKKLTPTRQKKTNNKNNLKTQNALHKRLKIKYQDTGIPNNIQ